MKKWQRIGICLVLAVSLLVLPACKKTQPATETTGAAKETTGAANTPSTPTAAPPASTPAETPEETQPDPIELYMEQYPEFFGISTEYGLTVYIMLTQEYTYRCRLLPTMEWGYSQEDLKDESQYTADIKAMRDIVAHYIDSGAITEGQLTVKGVLTAYGQQLFSVTDFFYTHVEAQFRASDALYNYGHIDDLAYLDIDDDGISEECAIFPSYTPGVGDFVMIACENGVPEYCNRFYQPFTFAQFGPNEEGKTVLHGWKLNRDGDHSRLPKEPYYIDVSVSDGNITLSCEDVAFNYCGEQGLQADYAPKPDAPEITLPEQIAAYRSQYPQCFNLSAENGLEVYVWHRHAVGYLCGLLPARERPYTQSELDTLDWRGVPMEVMRKIVRYYIDSGAVTKEQVTVRGVQLPSQTLYDRKVTDYFHQQVAYAFWAEEPIFNYTKYSTTIGIDKEVVYISGGTILGLSTFDIDGDGVQEQVALFPGRWSSIRCMELMVCQDGVVEYWNEFEYHEDWHLALEETVQGRARLVCTELDRIKEGNTTKTVFSDRKHYFDLGVVDGNIVIIILPGDTVQPFTYHGEQGVDAIPWPKQ